MVVLCLRADPPMPFSPASSTSVVFIFCLSLALDWTRLSPASRVLPSDDCCVDRGMLQKMFAELEEATGISFYMASSIGVQPVQLSGLQLESKPGVVHAKEAVDNAVGVIRESASEVEGKKVIGVDAEWETSVEGARQRWPPSRLPRCEAHPSSSIYRGVHMGSRGTRFPAPSAFCLRTPTSSR